MQKMHPGLCAITLITWICGLAKIPKSTVKCVIEKFFDRCVVNLQISVTNLPAAVRPHPLPGWPQHPPRPQRGPPPPGPACPSPALRPGPASVPSEFTQPLPFHHRMPSQKKDGPPPRPSPLTVRKPSRMDAGKRLDMAGVGFSAGVCSPRHRNPGR